MIIDELFEGPQLCPECGGISFSDLILAEKKDACYYKVKASAKVWPSAYASGRLVQCRKKRAANYGKSKTEGVAEGSLNEFAPSVATGGGKKDYGQPNSSRYLGGNKFVVGTTNNYILTATIDKYGLDWDDGWYLDSPGSAHLSDASEGEIPLPISTEQRHSIHALVADYLNNRNQADLQKVARHFGHGDDGQMNEQGVAEQQELDEKWSQKYKKSINCANPKGFSQRAHCAGRKKNEDVAEAGPIRRDPLDLPPLEGPGSGSGGGGGPSRSGPSPFTPVKIPGTNINIPGVTQSTSPPPTVTKPPNINRQIDPASDVPAYVRKGLPDPVTTPVGKPKITVRPGETQSQAMQRTKAEQEFGQFLKGQSGQTFGAGAGRGTVNPEPAKQQKFPEPKTDKQREWDEFKKKHGFDPVDKIEYDYNKYLDAMAAQVKQKGPPPIPSKKSKWKTPDVDIELEEASRKKREEPEVDYDDEYDAMVARVKKLAGLGPMKTVYDPTKRVYRNMPTAVQPKK